MPPDSALPRMRMSGLTASWCTASMRPVRASPVCTCAAPQAPSSPRLQACQLQPTRYVHTGVTIPGIRIICLPCSCRVNAFPRNDQHLAELSFSRLGNRGRRTAPCCQAPVLSAPTLGAAPAPRLQSAGHCAAAAAPARLSGTLGRAPPRPPRPARGQPRLPLRPVLEAYHCNGHSVTCPWLKVKQHALATLQCCSRQPSCTHTKTRVRACLDRLHHEGHDVGVLVQRGLQRAQVIVRDALKARHVGPEPAKALRVCGRAARPRQPPPATVCGRGLPTGHLLCNWRAFCLLPCPAPWCCVLRPWTHIRCRGPAARSHLVRRVLRCANRPAGEPGSEERRQTSFVWTPNKQRRMSPLCDHCWFGAARGAAKLRAHAFEQGAAHWLCRASTRERQPCVRRRSVGRA